MIQIKSLELLASLGVPAEERAERQRILIDLKVKADFSKATSDQIEDTVNYDEIVKLIKLEVERKSWALLEKMTADLNTLIFALDSRISKIEITVKKFIYPDTKFVSYTLKQKRADHDL